MQVTLDPYIKAAIERQRIEALFARLPGSVISVLVGVLLVFVFLLPTAPPGMMKAWAAYMLTSLALRSWLWGQFRSNIIDNNHLRRWEWACAGGMLLTGLGWAILCGPLFPRESNLQNFVWVLILVVAQTCMVMAASSRLAFAMFVIPTLLPGLWRFIEVNGSTSSAITAAIGCLIVIVVMHQQMRATLVEHLSKRVEAETLLAEQQAIFLSATVGIAVFDGETLLKCNPRFGELFGRSLQASAQLPASELFMQNEEAQRFLAWSATESDAGRTAHSMERLRRADGSQFWAEMSAQRMYYGETPRSLWLVSEAAMQQRGDDRMLPGSHGGHRSD